MIINGSSFTSMDNFQIWWWLQTSLSATMLHFDNNTESKAKACDGFLNHYFIWILLVELTSDMDDTYGKWGK